MIIVHCFVCADDYESMIITHCFVCVDDDDDDEDDSDGRREGDSSVNGRRNLHLGSSDDMINEHYYDVPEVTV